MGSVESSADTPDPAAPLDPHVRAALALTSRAGGYALLLGAGISRSAGVPSAWEVLEDLIMRVAGTVGEPDLADPVEWWRSRYGEVMYGGVLEQLATTPEERRALLEEYFVRNVDDPPGEKSPTEGHRGVARMVKAGLVRIVVTTNFDLLLEAALRAEGIEPQVVSTPEAIGALEPLHSLRCVVIHVNGDYTQAGLANTEAELGRYEPAVERVLTQVFDEYGLVVVGWSAKWDVALAELLTKAEPPRYSSWWIEPADLNPAQLRLMQLRAAEPIQRTADAALAEIADMCESLMERSARTRPITVAAAVGAAKQELARAGPAIRTHDRLRVALEKLETSPVVRPPTWDGGDAEVHRRVRTLMSDAGVALGLVAALAYWGDETTDRWWFDAIERFAYRPHVGGRTDLIRLSRAPATLLLYAAGVGATAASRWSLVGRILREPQAETHNGGQLAPVSLALPPESIGLPHGVQHIYAELWDIFRFSLGLDVGSFVEAWERFEYVHHLTWLDAHRVEGASGGYLGWTPHLRIAGLGPEEAAAVPARWLLRLVETDEVRAGELGFEPDRLADAQLAFAVAFAQYGRNADWTLISPGGGALPSGRHYPGRYDDDPTPLFDTYGSVRPAGG